jgi:hypothetical protein
VDEPWAEDAARLVLTAVTPYPEPIRLLRRAINERAHLRSEILRLEKEMAGARQALRVATEHGMAQGIELAAVEIETKATARESAAHRLVELGHLDFAGISRRDAGLLRRLAACVRALTTES